MTFINDILDGVSDFIDMSFENGYHWYFIGLLILLILYFVVF